MERKVSPTPRTNKNRSLLQKNNITIEMIKNCIELKEMASKQGGEE